MMPRRHNPQDTEENTEAGYLLLGMIVLCALVLIALAVAAPIMARQLRRDKEVESQHRAEQYTRAIRLYYRKNKSYPPSMEALEKSNNIRFLRQKYVDPLTGKSDWRLIHVGQNQTTVKGFFGEPLGGLDSAGGLGSAAGLQSTTGGNTATPAPGAPGAGPTATTTISAGGLAGGFNGATIGGSTGTNTTPAPGTDQSSTDPLSGGGGQIMGVGTSRSGDSITAPNQQTTYDTWEFLYDPRIELMYQKGALNSGVGSTAASAFGSDAASGQPNSGSSNNPTGSPAPTAPSGAYGH